MRKRAPASMQLLLVLAAVGACGGSTSDPGGSPTGTGGANSNGTAGGSGTAGATNAGSGGESDASVAGASGSSSTGGGGGASGSGGAVTDGEAAPPIRDGGMDTGATGTGCSNPGTLCWDFEQGALPPGWTASRNEFSGAIVVDSSKAHKGTYALHAKDLQGGTPGVSGGPKKSIKYSLPANFGPVLWGRAFVYTTPERPMSHAGLFNARYPRPNSTATAMDQLDWYEVASYQQRYMSIWHPPEPPGFPEWVKLSDTQLALDKWTCLEWLFDGANGTDPQAAEPRVWLDGVELTWPTEFTFSDPDGAAKPTREKAQNFVMLETGVYLYQGLTTVTNWWIDDLAVGKARIGCN